MRYIEETTDFQLHNSVVTLGKFDGLHIGHQMLINHVIELKNQGYQSVMFTFSLHPYNLFSEKEVSLIYTNQEKLSKLQKQGLDVLIAYPFTKETASLEPEEFIREVLVKKVDAKVIVVGKDFCFGKNRSGNVDLLKKYEKMYGYKVYAYEKVEYDGAVVGSTRIREELAKGNLEEVNYMLSKPYSIRETVIHGRKLGRTLGMPTINMVPPANKLLPPNGVYASTVEIDGKEYYSVSNIGLKPTVGDETRTGIETFIFDYEGDLYGRELEVSLYQFQRPETKFSSVEELKGQMEQDIVNAKEFFQQVIVR